MRIRYIIRCVFYYLIESRLTVAPKEKDNTGEILIVYTDAIGDYILFRNFIQVLKQSGKYKNHRITLCGNQAFRDLADHFDAGFIDDFVWLNRSQFERNFSYRQNFLKLIRKRKFDVVLNPSYSRDFVFGDSIVRQANAKIKIGQVTNSANAYRLFTLLSDKWYTSLLNTGEEVIFDFCRNKKFVEMLIGEKISIRQPSLPVQSEKEPLLIIFPGAGEKQKQWKAENFVALASYITQKEKYRIVICGSESDHVLGEQIEHELALKDSSNLCGKTSLVDLAKLISKASLLLTNDSSALHIAACTNTRAICVGNGRHYGRFTPYPDGMAPNLHFVFPDKVNEMVNSDVETLKKLTIKQSIASIHDIKVDDVIRLYNQGI